MEAGELVGGEIVIGDAAIGVEVFAIGASIDRADGHDKPQAIRGRHFPSTPALGQGHGGLGIDQTGIGPGEGLGPEIVLLHPTEPATRQRGNIRADHGFEANITGFREQDRAETDRQVGDAGRPVADMA